MAKYFVEETGRGTDGHKLSEYSQDHKPILQQDEIVGHAVRAGYLYSGVADVAALTHDTAYFHALTRLWDNLVSKKLYITGGMGSRAQGEGFGPNYELQNHTAYVRPALLSPMYIGTTVCSLPRANRNTSMCWNVRFTTVSSAACRSVATSSSTTIRWNRWDSTNANVGSAALVARAT